MGLGLGRSACRGRARPAVAFSTLLLEPLHVLVRVRVRVRVRIRVRVRARVRVRLGLWLGLELHDLEERPTRQIDRPLHLRVHAAELLG